LLPPAIARRDNKTDLTGRAGESKINEIEQLSLLGLFCFIESSLFSSLSLWERARERARVRDWRLTHTLTPTLSQGERETKQSSHKNSRR
jgi:hypothetical protein